MNECGVCHDRYPDTEVHNCWVQHKINTQDVLPEPPVTDQVRFRAPLTDHELERDRGD